MELSGTSGHAPYDHPPSHSSMIAFAFSFSPASAVTLGFTSSMAAWITWPGVPSTPNASRMYWTCSAKLPRGFATAFEPPVGRTADEEASAGTGSVALRIAA